ncbi:hypothetical protein SDC9_36089 [bioreactor metagenome]|uniref:Uncharacterized protein n=1 Tax=bioreactor metagenome TaxID=1076179 RepID=A0A644VF61_9ZZZZ
MGHRDRRRRVGLRLVGDVQHRGTGLGAQGIGDAGVHPARKALIAGGRDEAEPDRSGAFLLDLPQPAVPAVGAAMQGGAALVHRKPHLAPVKREPPAGDAVRDPADGGAEEAAMRQIARQPVVAENDVVGLARPVGHEQGLQRRPEGDDPRRHPAGGQGEALDLAAVGQGAEGLSHPSKASTRRRSPSRKMSATSCNGARSTSDAPVAISSAKRA